MALAGDIQMLRDRALHDLDAAHDYYTHTRIAWRIVRKVVESGYSFRVRNRSTGSAITQSEIAARARAYVAEQLAEATFQQFISIFEGFLFDFLRRWLFEYPQNLWGKSIDFKDVWEAADKDSIAGLVIDRELSDVFYRRPSAWFEYLNTRVNLGCPSAIQIEAIAEAKASRDVLAHNRGVAGKTYQAKAGPRARFRNGERIAIPEQYHRETWEILRQVVSDISDAAVRKVS